MCTAQSIHIDAAVERASNERIVEKRSLAVEGSRTSAFDREGSRARLTMRRRPRSLWRLRLFDALVDRFDGPATDRFPAEPKELVEATGVPAESASARSAR
jgi:hypothetical protein